LYGNAPLDCFRLCSKSDQNVEISFETPRGGNLPGFFYHRRREEVVLKVRVRLNKTVPASRLTQIKDIWLDEGRRRMLE
jgi:hypothetical protein